MALANYNQKESKNVVYFFLIYFGLSFFVNDTGMDSVRYAQMFQHNATLPLTEFFRIIGGLYSDTSIDIAEPFISFLVSRFTDNYKFLFAAYAAVYGFFYLKSIELLYEKYRQNAGLNAWIFMFFFITTLSINNINGFRMWTALWVFFYGASQVILYEKRKYLLLALCSILIHGSFISANFVLIIYVIAGNRNLIYLIVAISSFILPNILLPFFDTISLRLGGGYRAKYLGYSNEDLVSSLQERSQQASWFLPLSKELVFYYFLFMIILIYYLLKDRVKERSENNLFNFLLLFLSFVNFAKPIPAFGGRFQILFILFATLFVFLYFIKLPTAKLHLLTVLGIFPMLLYTAVQFRIGSETINSWIFMPAFGLPLFVPGISLAEFLFR